MAPSNEIYYMDGVCPACGAWGLHNCLGYRSATKVTIEPDWNHLINAFDRLVTLLEKYLGDKV